MPKTLAAESSPNTLNPALLALKPRQVLISRPDMGKESKTLILESEQKVILLRSIAQYLERCGFSKCFKKLLSEAEIEKKELNSTLPDLEAIYSQFLKKSHPQAVEVKVESGDDQETDRKQKKKEVVVNGSSEANAMEGIENVKKEKKEKKKKKKETKMEVTKEEKVKETDAEVKETDAEVKETDAEIKETDAEIKETDAEIKETDAEIKETDAEIKETDAEIKETDAEIKETDAEIKKTDAEIKDVVKEKKKKKNKSKSIEAESLGNDDKERVSKKRKRSDPEETKEQTDGDEESKRMKKEENVEDNKCVQETPVKQTNVEENGNIGKSDMKSTNQKSGKGLSNSKEPKKPFQRVNVEEIVFTDDRLKDNSYWAKDGADSGYGAKAQEVLGQVRGRGFRHEKTKKKRGSYRGGEIDLQSHSVKFDYSDEE